MAPDILFCRCGRRHSEPRVWPLVCRCGCRIGGEYAEPIAPPRHHAKSIRHVPRVKPPELPCLQRGEPIRKLDCGCEGNSTLYRCGINGECLLRPLPASTFRGATCDACDVRQDPKERAAIVTFHYNPARRQRLRDTFTEWAATIGHPFECWELAFAEPEIPGSIAIRGDAGNVLWQKERLINLAITRLPPEVDYVAWIDHDLIFDNPAWLDIGIDMIRRGVDVVQLFSEVAYQERDGSVSRRRRGSVSAWQTTGEIGDSAPGGAWIASRAWLCSIGGLYEHNICGGGDATFLHAVTKCKTNYVDRQAPKLRDDCLAYGDRVSASVGYVPGAVRHLWHGDRSNRQYLSRDEILSRHGFDPATHLRISENGLLELSNAPDGLADEIARYFADRRDDG
jgi:hypothetical protein